MHKRIVTYTTVHGIELQIKPVSAMMMQGLNRKAQELYPDPQVPMLKMEGALDDTQTVPDYEDKNYKEGVKRALQKRLLYVTDAMYKLGVDVADRDSIISFYRDDIDAYKAYARVDDDWQGALEAVILSDPNDVEAIVKILRDKLPLEPHEVANGIKTFRTSME